MPQMKDVFREGPEYIRRMIRRAMLRSRLNDERSGLRRVLTGLGRIAWEMEAPSCGGAPTGEELRGFDAAEKDTLSLEEENNRRLNEKILQAETEADQAKAAVNETTSRLDGARRQAESRKQAISQCETQIDSIRSETERSESELERLAQTGSGGEEAPSASELTASKEALGHKIEELTAKQKELTARLKANRRALPPLEKTIHSLAAEREDLVTKLTESNERLERLRKESREAAKAGKLAAKERQAKRVGLYERLGKELLKRRSDEPELQPFFISTDLALSTLETLEHDIEAETRLLELMDRNAVAAFVGIAFGAGVLALMLISLLITLIVVL